LLSEENSPTASSRLASIGSNMSAGARRHKWPCSGRAGLTDAGGHNGAVFSPSVENLVA